MKQMIEKKGVVRILHLGDMFFHGQLDRAKCLKLLLNDLTGPDPALAVPCINLIVACGDFTWSTYPGDLLMCQRFFRDLTRALNLRLESCLFVPGNHDVEWNRDVYDYYPASRAYMDRVEPEARALQGETVFIRRDSNYGDRFINFAENFYEPLTGQTWPTDPARQFHLINHTWTGVQLLGLNSCSKTDRFFERRALLNQEAVTEALQAASDEKAGLRIAAWHHPTHGDNGIDWGEPVTRLIEGGFRLFLHAHVHSERKEDYLRMNDQVYYIGAGGLNRALIREERKIRVRLYNLIEWNPETDEVTVHQRVFNTMRDRWQAWA